MWQHQNADALTGTVKLASRAVCGLGVERVAGGDDDTGLPAMPAIASQAAVISHAVWLYFRFPLSSACRGNPGGLRHPRHPRNHPAMAWKFGQVYANRIRRRLPPAGDKWHLDEVR